MNKTNNPSLFLLLAISLPLWLTACIVASSGDEPPAPLLPPKLEFLAPTDGFEVVGGSTLQITLGLDASDPKSWEPATIDIHLGSSITGSGMRLGPRIHQFQNGAKVNTLTFYWDTTGVAPSDIPYGLRFIAKSVAGKYSWMDDKGLRRVLIVASRPYSLTAPESQTVVAGAAVLFEARFTGSGPLTYRWQRSIDDGLNYVDETRPGADTPRLELASVTTDDAGLYRLRASNPEAPDGVTSAPARLTVTEVTVLPEVAAADVSPTLPAGVDSHFTGVTQFIVAKLSHAEAQLDVSCALHAGGDCGWIFTATPATGFPPMSEVQLPHLMQEEKYDFSLRANDSGALSDPFPLTVELRPGVGEVACERATNGLFGDQEVRHMGLQLLTLGGSPVPSADYHVYERGQSGQGWIRVPASFGAPFLGSPFVHLDFAAADFDTNRNFLVIAVDTSTDTAVAAREFFWTQPESIPTQGCRVCDMSQTGDCTIIPRQ